MKKILIFSLIFILIPLTKTEDTYKSISHTTFAAKPRPYKHDQPEVSFAYGNIGAYSMTFLIPDCGIGYRNQKNHIGFDISFTVSPCFICNVLKTNPAVLCYFHPNLEGEWYMGFGLGMGVIIPSTRSFLQDTFYAFDPALIIGKQYKNAAGKNRFIDVRIGGLLLHSRYPRHFIEKYDLFRAPLFSVNFGIGF